MSRQYCNLIGDIATDEQNTCCKLHDNSYGKRGAKLSDGSYKTRKQADDDLLQCVGGIKGRSAWVACRLFGWIFWDKEKTND